MYHACQIYARDFNSGRCYLTSRRVFQWKILAWFWKLMAPRGLTDRMLLIPTVRPAMLSDCDNDTILEIPLEKYWKDIQDA